MKTSFLPRLLVLALAAAAPADAYLLNGRFSPNGNIEMNLQLGSPATALQDGATAWSTPAVSALNEWNAQMVRCQFTTVIDSTIPKVQGDNRNSVFFSGDVYGDAWGASTLAVTLSYKNVLNFTLEADVLFNTGVTWNSYRGAIQRSGTTTTQDFRRVALHEFGHVLGLGHPDTATPVQTVSAIMNSTASNTESLQSDDIAGVKALYGANITPPTITANPVGATVTTMGTYTLNVAATGTTPFTYVWVYRAPGSTATELYQLIKTGTYTFGSVQPADAGTYYAFVSNMGGYGLSTGATLNVNPVGVSAASRLANISTRGVAGTGDGILIAGFVIGGSGTKTVLVRGAGPVLANFGLGGVLLDPKLEITRQDGSVIASNDNWETGNDVAALNSAFTRLGAFNLPAGGKDSALLVNLPPGIYSAKLSGVGSTSGVALIEAYDADPNPSVALSRKLLNISTRGQVGTGDNIMIAGLVVDGPAPRRFLIRAVGPTLANYGVPNVLDDPVLQVVDASGNLLKENDDWDTPLSGQQALTDAGNIVGASPMQVRRDSAMIMTLNPGLYSAKVSGFGGTTGVALVEIYEMPN